MQSKSLVSPYCLTPNSENCNLGQRNKLIMLTPKLQIHHSSQLHSDQLHYSNLCPPTHPPRKDVSASRQFRPFLHSLIFFSIFLFLKKRFFPLYHLINTVNVFRNILHKMCIRDRSPASSLYFARADTEFASLVV